VKLKDKVEGEEEGDQMRGMLYTIYSFILHQQRLREEAERLAATPTAKEEEGEEHLDKEAAHLAISPSISPAACERLQDKVCPSVDPQKDG
jgi:hypothetical protein